MLPALGEKKKKKLFRDVYIRSNQTNPKLAPNNFPGFPKKKKRLCGSFNSITTVMVPASGAETLQVDFRDQGKYFFPMVW